MGQVLVWILFVAFLIRTVRNSLYQVFLWQLKEYRLDRMLVHLKIWQGKRMIFGPWSLVKFGLIGAYLARLPIFWPVFFLYFLEGGRDLGSLGWKRPVFTLKASFVLIFVILIEAGGIINLANLDDLANLAFFALILDKILAPTIAFLFLLLALPTKIQRIIIINKAKKLIQDHPKLLTIGITGSYGKTSTKEFLASILGEKFKVLKTVGSNNTDIGVAKTIVENLKDQQIFVCEMAAYKRGEIKAICDIVHPKIGIITGINEQHLDLFGSLENTIRTKYELIEALPADGLAVFSGNNQYTKEMSKKARAGGLKTILYYCHSTIVQQGGGVVANNINVFPGRLTFEVVIGEEKKTIGANLLGKQNVENILGAVIVAHYLGMSLPEIAEAIKNLLPPEMTMEPVPGPSGSTLINDTFNANPAGVLAAIEYAKVFKGKKILVLQPMIELGKAAEEAHRKVGKEAARVCDLVILTNKNFNEPFIEGAARTKGGEDKVVVLDSYKTVLTIEKMVDKESVVVFEGKEAAKMLKILKRGQNV